MSERVAPPAPQPVPPPLGVAEPEHWFLRLPAGALAAGGLAALTLLAGGLALSAPFRGRCPGFDAATDFAGTTGRPPGLRAAACAGWQVYLLLDLLVIAGYFGVSVVILLAGWRRYRARQVVRMTGAVLALPVLVALSDGAGDLLLLAGLTVRSGSLVFRYDVLAAATSVLAWTTWLGAAALTIALIMALLMLIRPPVAVQEVPVDLVKDRGARGTQGVSESPAAGQPWGIALSGGGIRAAAFGLGAMSVLEEEIAPRCRWISAVSGGAYTATSWSLVRAADAAAPGPARTTAAKDIYRHLVTDNARTGRPNFQYLFNAPGGLARTVGRAVAGVVVSLAMISVFFVVVAWPLGHLIGSSLMHPELKGVRGAELAARFRPVPGLWLPGATYLGLSVLVLIVAAVVGRPQWRVGVLSAGLLVVGLIFLGGLVVLPWLLVAVASLLRGGSTGAATALIGGSSALAAIGLVWRFVSAPAMAAVSKALPRLGGVLLLVAGLCLSSWVMLNSATGIGVLHSVWVWVGAVAVFAGIYLGMTRIRRLLSLQHLYGRSLVRTFGLTRDDAGAVVVDSGPPRAWSDLAPDGPELVLCCTQASADIGAGGFRAESFTISPSTVRWVSSRTAPDSPRSVRRELSCATTEYLDRFPASGNRDSVASWMGVTGAAFASAMGRASLGSTGALLAAANVSLGSWMVNPGLQPDAGQRLRAPGLAYLGKEILGWYNDDDAYLYVTDGGHWDNLGLVELLRRGCRSVVCIDASGDARPDGMQTFRTLRQALKLATLELDTIVDFDLTGLEEITGTSDRPPSTLATVLIARDAAGGEVSRIYYAKAQVCSTVDRELRIYAASDPKFPNYSTGDQFLTRAQFGDLYLLGEEAARDVVELIGRGRLDPATTTATAASTAASGSTASAAGTVPVPAQQDRVLAAPLV